MSLDTTPGSATGNSFATVAEFDTYHVNRYPQIEWILTATTPLKEALLIMAGRLLNNDFAWTGAAVDSVQAMTWPRSGMLSRNGYTLPTTGALSYPIDLKNAQCEWAGQLGAADLVSDDDAAKGNLSSVRAGSVAVAFQSVNTSSQESVDMILRRLGSEFNYLSNEVPGEVRRLLVPSWFNQPTIIRKLLFKAF